MESVPPTSTPAAANAPAPLGSPADVVRVRFAPSPTGALHLGSAMVALANFAYAQAHDGHMILRIDDTDQVRSTRDSTNSILQLLDWLSISWHGDVVTQSARAKQHHAALEQLEASGAAYPCFCGDARLAQLREQQTAAGLPPRYDGRCRALPADEVVRLLNDGAPHVLRFAVPEGRDVSFVDGIQGVVKIPAGSFGDPILVRADGRPGYLLASVVDDLDLAITHIIRGEDHLPNTARQLLLMEALGCPPAALPHFAHLPLLRSDDGRKLSKRDPLGTLDELVDAGYLPVTIRRYLGELLGQGAVDALAVDAPPFDIDRVASGAPRVDRHRLDALGRHDMAELDVDELITRFEIEDETSDVRQLIGELASASAALVMLRGDLCLVMDGPGVADLPFLLPLVGEDLVPVLRMVSTTLAKTADTENWAVEWLAAIRTNAKAFGGVRGVLRPTRVALTGTTHGPALDLIARAIGRDEVGRRLLAALLVGGDLGETG